jgi:hypothetical protein
MLWRSARCTSSCSAAAAGTAQTRRPADAFRWAGAPGGEALGEDHHSQSGRRHPDEPHPSGLHRGCRRLNARWCGDITWVQGKPPPALSSARHQRRRGPRPARSWSGQSPPNASEEPLLTRAPFYLGDTTMNQSATSCFAASPQRAPPWPGRGDVARQPCCFGSAAPRCWSGPDTLTSTYGWRDTGRFRSTGGCSCWTRSLPLRLPRSCSPGRGRSPGCSPRASSARSSAP